MFEHLSQSISKNGTGKNTLINFIVEFNSNIPQKKNRTKAYQGWGFPSLMGPSMILLLFSFIPTAEASKLLYTTQKIADFTHYVFRQFDIDKEMWTRSQQFGSGDVMGISGLIFIGYLFFKINNYFKTSEEKEKQKRR